MTEREAVEKLKAYSKCQSLQVKGIYEDCNNKRCDNCDLCYMQGTTGEHLEALDMAIQALEKTAKKPQKNGLYSAHSGIFRKIPAYTCPSCGNMCLEKWATERSITSYCWDCGQKLDWSDAD